MRSFPSIVGAAALAAACLAAVAAADSGEAFEWQLPSGFPVPHVPADNPMSRPKVALGCRLFFETRLSATGAHSCASCHRPELAFTDGLARAKGATGAATPRSAMSLANVAYNPALTWASDRVTTLESQMERPLFNEHPVEMGMKRDDAALISWLTQDGEYAAAFRASFPAESQPVSMQNLIKAIAAFERTLISGRSAFDRYVYDDDRAGYSAAAKRGMQLFFSDRAGCSVCHSGINFSGPPLHRGAPQQAATFANTGTSRPGTDRGLMEASGKRSDLGRFRVPTLRNVALTAPYMHDGSIGTLEEVIEHYASGGRRAAADGVGRIDPAMRSLDLSDGDKRDLLEFLRSLTDQQFIGTDYSSCVPPRP